jgi:hypothetical protein
MSYDTTRDSEQLRVIDPSIDEFIERYNNSSGPATGTRQTVFLFPGGMACTLKRATKSYVDGTSTPQTFTYDTVWLKPETIVWPVDVLDLKMTKVAPGKYRDKADRIIVADGAVGYLGCTPYLGFTIWCKLKGLDYFVFGWDWRRRLEDSGTFFVKKFLPHFQARVMSECNNADPLENFSLIGHSAGGMVVNWILRKGDANVANMRRAITVATPFYGYTSQVHRWFEGQPPFNGLADVFKNGIIKVICSCPACYAWMFLDEKKTYTQNKVALAADPKYPLLTYPSVDKLTGVVADPYSPQTNGTLSRYPAPSATGFDATELAHAKKLVRYLASSLDPSLAAKFINIRGDTTANDTAGSTKWAWVPPTDPSPITDGVGVPGDGTQPAWSARHVGLADAFSSNVITVKGTSVEHMFTMNSPKTLGALAGVLGV